jgi:hypothetical protein
MRTKSDAALRQFGAGRTIKSGGRPGLRGGRPGAFRPNSQADRAVNV